MQKRSRNAADMLQRCIRNPSEMLPKCCRSASEMLQKRWVRSHFGSSHFGSSYLGSGRVCVCVCVPQGASPVCAPTRSFAQAKLRILRSKSRVQASLPFVTASGFVARELGLPRSLVGRSRPVSACSSLHGGCCPVGSVRAFGDRRGPSRPLLHLVVCA